MCADHHGTTRILQAGDGQVWGCACRVHLTIQHTNASTGTHAVQWWRVGRVIQESVLHPRTNSIGSPPVSRAHPQNTPDSHNVHDIGPNCVQSGVGKREGAGSRPAIQSPLTLSNWSGTGRAGRTGPGLPTPENKYNTFTVWTRAGCLSPWGAEASGCLASCHPREPGGTAGFPADPSPHRCCKQELQAGLRRGGT